MQDFSKDLYLALFSLLNLHWVQIAVLQLSMETLHKHTHSVQPEDFAIKPTSS